MFGESQLWDINRKRFSNSLPKFRTRLKYFSGRKAKVLEYFVTLTLDEQKPDIVVIHMDSSDIDFQQLRHNTVKIIGKDIISIGQKCRESEVFKVTISSILVKNNIKVTKFIRHLNYFLRNLCLMNDFYFISNDNTLRDFNFQYYVYLNNDGTCILAGHFVDFVSAINNF